MTNQKARLQRILKIARIFEAYKMKAESSLFLSDAEIDRLAKSLREDLNAVLEEERQEVINTVVNSPNYWS